eukprot:TRINITY_DN1529_c0_g2_i1.p1 TRINITY_DN1529_c0_g2~~TRINITY_DN1529_c0_g2_i1.p1  ORF type:complete len:166 (-),score=72.44 TRINITY_DN1529_c0_g2_i1:59-556(-)
MSQNGEKKTSSPFVVKKRSIKEIEEEDAKALAAIPKNMSQKARRAMIMSEICKLSSVHLTQMSKLFQEIAKIDEEGDSEKKKTKKKPHWTLEELDAIEKGRKKALSVEELQKALPNKSIPEIKKQLELYDVAEGKSPKKQRTSSDSSSSSSKQSPASSKSKDKRK